MSLQIITFKQTNIHCALFYQIRNRIEKIFFENKLNLKSP